MSYYTQNPNQNWCKNSISSICGYFAKPQQKEELSNVIQTITQDKMDESIIEYNNKMLDKTWCYQIVIFLLIILGVKLSLLIISTHFMYRIVLCLSSGPL